MTMLSWLRNLTPLLTPEAADRMKTVMIMTTITTWQTKPLLSTGHRPVIHPVQIDEYPVLYTAQECRSQLGKEAGQERDGKDKDQARYHNSLFKSSGQVFGAAHCISCFVWIANVHDTVFPLVISVCRIVHARVSSVFYPDGETLPGCECFFTHRPA
jgi:hypothetical protein